MPVPWFRQRARGGADFEALPPRGRRHRHASICLFYPRRRERVMQVQTSSCLITQPTSVSALCWDSVPHAGSAPEANYGTK